MTAAGGSVPSADGSDSSFVAHSDEPPPGVDMTRIPSVLELTSATGLNLAGDDSEVSAGADYVPPGEPGITEFEEHVAPSCSGTGTDGNRVQVMYVIEEGQTDRYSSLRTSLLSWIGDVDDTFAATAHKTGGDVRVRWVHKNCVPVIERVTLPEGALTDGFSATVEALKELDYTSKARKYLVFADAAILCGWAQGYNDSSKTNNKNDGRYPVFARVDSPCWTFRSKSIAAHEVMHNLGGIQSDAPHSNYPGVHCFDESDVMCYDDGKGGVPMQSICSDTESLFDCRNDDYFSLRPTPGSYLDTHWNNADSSFLDDISRHETKTSMTASPTLITAGDATTLSGTVARLDKGPAVAGETVTLYWRPAGTDEWSKVTSTMTDDAGSYSFSMRPSENGAYRAALTPQTKKYVGSQSTSRTVDVRPAITASFDFTPMVRGISVRLSGAVSPDHPGDLVYLRRLEAGAWETVDAQTLTSTSRFSFTIRHSTPGSYQYQIYVPGHYDHAAGSSPTRTLQVL